MADWLLGDRRAVGGGRGVGGGARGSKPAGVACSGEGDPTKGSLRLLTDPSFFFTLPGKGCLAAGAVCK